MSTPQKSVSAQVLLNAAGVAKQLTDAGGAARAAFAAAGFKVGALIGNNFSITGPASLFDKFFQVKLARTDRGGLQAARDDSSAGEALPVTALPAPLGEQVAAVTFTPPPDFGPTAY
jgi:hypothetical protein